MKKIITLCSLILCLAVVVTAFTSCKGKENNNNNETETYVAAITNGEFSFTAEVGESSTIIKNNGEEYQTLQYPVNAGYAFDYAYAKDRSQFIDMNFDGQPDFYIAVSAEAETIYYYCWLFNATTKKFDFSVSLSGLTNISVDADTHTIYSTYDYADTTKIMSYKWVDGQLVNVDVYDNSTDTIPYEVTQAAAENVIGSVTKPALTTKAPKTTKENKNPDKNNKPDNNKGDSTSTGTTKENSENVPEDTTKPDNKPLGTTTTAPHVPGVQIETGNIDAGWY